MESPRDPLPADVSAEPEPADPPPAKVSRPEPAAAAAVNAPYLVGVITAAAPLASSAA